MERVNRLARAKNRTARRSTLMDLLRARHHRLCIILLREQMCLLHRLGAALSSPKLVALAERVSQHSVILAGMARQTELPRKHPVRST